MARMMQKKFGTFTCHCGCKQTFTAEYTTRAPQYLDKKHRLSKLAKNKAASRAQKTKDLFRQYKERRAGFVKLGIPAPIAARFARATNDKEFLRVAEAVQKSRLKGGDHD